MRDAVVLMNGYIVYLDTITDTSIYDPEITEIIFDNSSGRVRQFTKDGVTYMAVFDLAPPYKFKRYVNTLDFWNSAVPAGNDYAIYWGNSPIESSVFKVKDFLGFWDILNQYGPGVDQGRGVEKGTRVVMVQEYIAYSGIGSLFVHKRSFKFPERNLNDDENFWNGIQSFSDYLEHPEIIFPIQIQSIEEYPNSVASKEYLNENGLYFFESNDRIIIDEITFLFVKILDYNSECKDYLINNDLYIIFQTHFDIINTFDYDENNPNNFAQPFYHKNYTKKYFNILRIRLIEFYYWSEGINFENVDKDDVLVRIISLFSHFELSQLPYTKLVELLEDMLKNNWWVKGKWNPIYSGTFLSEEEVIVKIIQSIAREDQNGNLNYSDIDLFMDLLNDIPRFEVDSSKNLFQVLYERINDDVFFGEAGKGAKGQFVRAVYNLWIESKYNPSHLDPIKADQALSYFTYTPYKHYDRSDYSLPKGAPSVINYESEKTLIWYIDNYKFEFRDRQIVALEEIPNYGYQPHGYYKVFQPVSIKSTNATDTIIKIPTNDCIPIFFLMYADDVGDNSDVKESLGVALDVVLTFSGIGNIAKLRYLTKVSMVRKFFQVGSLEIAEQVAVRTALAQTISGLNALLGVAHFAHTFATASCTVYYNDPNNPPQSSDPNYQKYLLCKQIDYWLFALEIATLSGDLLARRALKRATKQLSQSIPSGSQYDDLRNAVDGLPELNVLLDDFLDTLQTSHPTVHARVSTLPTQEKKFQFMFDFEGNTLALNEFKAGLQLNPPINLIDDWAEVVDELAHFRKDINYLKSYRRFTNNSHEVQHITDFHNGSTTGGFDPKGAHAGKNLNNGVLRDPNLPAPSGKIHTTAIFQAKNGHICYKHMYFPKPNGGFKLKTYQTVFNPAWDDLRIKGEMALAFKNKKLKSPSINTGRNIPGFSPPPQYESLYRSYLSDGTEVEIKMYNFAPDPVTNTIQRDHLGFFQLILR